MIEPKRAYYFSGICDVTGNGIVLELLFHAVFKKHPSQISLSNLIVYIKGSQTRVETTLALQMESRKKLTISYSCHLYYTSHTAWHDKIFKSHTIQI